MHSALRKRVRVRMNGDPQPSAGVVDSQSVKSTGVGGEERAYDGGKKVKGLNAEAFIYVAMSRLMARRLARS
jgi:putative transposase